MSKDNMGKATIKVSYTWLEQALKLPPDHHIERTYEFPGSVGLVYITCSGLTLPPHREGNTPVQMRLRRQSGKDYKRFDVGSMGEF